MQRWLLAIFVAVPLLEMYFLVQVAKRIGAGTTILAMLAMAMVGMVLVRREGLKTLLLIQERLTRGETPAAELLEGAMLVVAGILLIIPGFVTDAVGFLLAFPLSRILIRRWLLVPLLRRLPTDGSAGFHFTSAGGSGSGVIEGEFRRDQEPVTALPEASEPPAR